jgi:hypothetical protein
MWKLLLITGWEKWYTQQCSVINDSLRLQVWFETKQNHWVELDEKWTNKIQNFTWSLTESSTNSQYVGNFEI